MSVALRVAVAYSGGRDSTALLHATLKVARQQGVRVLALHIHHGLSPYADDWVEHCRAQCQTWYAQGLPVEFYFRRLYLDMSANCSVEAVAREGRYRALAELACELQVEIVLLGQHRLDQAETFLLQALRGAGVAGLAGMPQRFERYGMAWGRPWLHYSRQAIENYLAAEQLTYIDDDSNSDRAYARNRLRLEVWEPLSAAFPQAESMLATAAAWAAEATHLLVELAEQDWAQLSPEPMLGSALSWRQWRSLSTLRARNLLRAWFKVNTDSAMPVMLLKRLEQEWGPQGMYRWPCAHGMLCSYRGSLTFQAGSQLGLKELDSAILLQGDESGTVTIPGTGVYAFAGWAGFLVVNEVSTQGVDASYLTSVWLAERQGGEQFQMAANRPLRSLKKQFQAQGVPAWQRQGPLIFSADQLIYVPGLGIDARVWAPPGVMQFELSWISSVSA